MTTQADDDALKLAQEISATLDAHLAGWRKRCDVDFTDEQFFKMCRKSERDAYQLARALIRAREAQRTPGTVEVCSFCYRNMAIYNGLGCVSKDYVCPLRSPEKPRENSAHHKDRGAQVIDKTEAWDMRKAVSNEAPPGSANAPVDRPRGAFQTGFARIVAPGEPNSHATLIKATKNVLYSAYEKSVDQEAAPMIWQEIWNLVEPHLRKDEAGARGEPQEADDCETERGICAICHNRISCLAGCRIKGCPSFPKPTPPDDELREAYVKAMDAL